MEFEFVMGSTIHNTIIIAEINIRNHFSISFNEVLPFEMTEERDLEQKESFLENFEEEERQEIEEQIYYLGYEGYFDISLYSNNFNFPELENDIYFESIGCGQGDHRKDLIYSINSIDKNTDTKDINTKIFDLWDRLHLKEMESLSESDKQEINNLIEKIKTFDLDDQMEILARKLLIEDK